MFECVCVRKWIFENDLFNFLLQTQLFQIEVDRNYFCNHYSGTVAIIDNAIFHPNKFSLNQKKKKEKKNQFIKVIIFNK